MRTFVILGILIAPGAALGQIRVEPASRELGEIRGGRPVEAEFRVVNFGGQPVEIVELERGCGCIEPRWSTRVVASGRDATLTVRLRTLGQADGAKSWPMTIVTRSAGVASRHAVEVRAVVHNEIDVRPTHAAIFVSESIEREFSLVDRRPRPLTVVSWTIDVPGVRVERLAAEAGATRLKMFVDAGKMLPGRHDRVLHLFTDDAAYDHLEIPVTFVRVEKSSVAWSPETPEVILAPGQAAATALIQIRGLTSDVVAVDGDDGLACRWRTADDATYVRVTLERERFTGRGVQSAIRVRTAESAIAIPIVVRVE